MQANTWAACTQATVTVVPLRGSWHPPKRAITMYPYLQLFMTLMTLSCSIYQGASKTPKQCDCSNRQLSHINQPHRHQSSFSVPRSTGSTPTKDRLQMPNNTMMLLNCTDSSFQHAAPIPLLTPTPSSSHEQLFCELWDQAALQEGRSAQPRTTHPAL